MKRRDSNSFDIGIIKDRARKAIYPIEPATRKTTADKNFLFNALRTKASADLPPYYLVYFLLVEFLEFRNLGAFEKISWSVPIDFNGEGFLVEHRKSGIGVFSKDPTTQEEQAQEIVSEP